jgi:lipoprotein-releasing system permease protein
MNVLLEMRLAWRYVFSTRSRNLVHLISGISMFVIAAVTAAMVAVLSAFNGIEGVVEELFGTLDGDVALVAAEGSVVSNGLQDWLEVGAAGPEVVAWSRVLEGEAVVRMGQGEPLVSAVLGIDAQFTSVTPLETALRSGRWEAQRSGMPCAALGFGVRNQLGAQITSEQPTLLTLGAPRRGTRLARARERAFETVQVLATDVFSINADLDNRYLLVPLSTARELFDRPDSVSRFELRLAPGSDPDAVAASLRSALAASHPDVVPRTRGEKNRLITQTNRAEKWATFAILSFILVVAAFNVMASLTMLLLDKREDIQVLRAMGLPEPSIERAFSLQGLLINGVGGLLGLGTGVALVLGQQHYGWIALEGSIVPAYPVALEAWDLVGILAVVWILGGAGSAAMVRLLIRRLGR